MSLAAAILAMNKIAARTSIIKLFFATANLLTLSHAKKREELT